MFLQGRREAEVGIIPHLLQNVAAVGDVVGEEVGEEELLVEAGAGAEEG